MPISLHSIASRPQQLSDTRVQNLQNFSQAQEWQSLSSEEKNARFKKFEKDFISMGWKDSLSDYFLHGGDKAKTLRALALNSIASLPGGIEYLENNQKLVALTTGARYLLAGLTDEARRGLLQNARYESGQIVARLPVKGQENAGGASLDICVVLTEEVTSYSGEGALSKQQVRTILTENKFNGQSMLEQLADSIDPMSLHGARSVTALMERFTPDGAVDMGLMAKIHKRTSKAYESEGKWMEMARACNKAEALDQAALACNKAALAREKEAQACIDAVLARDNKEAQTHNIEAQTHDIEAQSHDIEAQTHDKEAQVCIDAQEFEQAVQAREKEALAREKEALAREKAAQAYEKETQTYENAGKLDQAARARDQATLTRDQAVWARDQATRARRNAKEFESSY